MSGGAEFDEASRREIVEKLKAMGAPTEVIERVKGKKVPKAFRVLPENAGAVNVFRAAETQWRSVSVGMGGTFLAGLDYAALPAIFEALEIANRAKVFKQLQVMERAALSAMREERGD